MKAIIRNIVIVPVLALSLITPALAQTTTPTENAPEAPKGLPACGAWYQSNKTPIALTASAESVAAGETVSFSGTLTNEAPYAIADMNVYVKVFRDRTPGARDVNGPDVVDWFHAVSDISLKAGESRWVTISWKVPTGAQPGRYTLGTYVTGSDQFDLQGLTFSDDAVGNITNFTVTGDDNGALVFDKTSVTVAGQPFYFATFPPVVLATSSVVITADIANSMEDTVRGTVTWKLYSWDGISEDRLIEESHDDITLPTKSKAALTYTVTDTAHSVYYLVGDVVAENGTRSVIGARFLRNGVDEPRFSAAGSDYPLVGGESKLFVCAQNAGNRIAKDVVFSVLVVPHGVRSLFGPVAEATYEGGFPPSALALPLQAQKSATSFDVIARLTQNGTVIDSITIPYSCSALGTPCNILDTWYLLYVALILVLLIALALYIRTRRRKKRMYT
ncbi:hypothetical protein GW943_02970 [Candidatus Parcubacteria bacterium]|uniref:Alpha-galactosidase NEW3 domain-containing protein n=1 Tax=Candidatus Kaiserbacteria bacterium CG10_big_fil_rev_8_21_14_0_10_47_16 TaxID=1974608 RepID=A0A2H0UE28_9BACT|nr:hypothetical protein [Candidatus Parcubacteria bacterium]PIR84637.1 MAG: hypothetical protein COU16_03635 [Candidatus Kaiserbacteria bacterium CG10_big_fil_rev_8_21_14_0_10_47_16]